MRRSRSLPASGSIRRSLSPATVSSAARRPLVFPINSRETRSGMSRSRCAMPISTTSTPGTSCGCARSGGSTMPPLAIGRAPSGSLRSESISGATRISPGGVTKDCRPARPIVGALPTSAGSVTGSIPNSRNERPPIWMRPSRTGDTGQPARRSSTNSDCGKLPPSRPTSIAVRAPPKVAAARS